MMSDLLGQRMFVGTSTSKTDEFVRISVGICITVVCISVEKLRVTY